MVLGGGVVGTHAAGVAAGLGAIVPISELNPTRLEVLNSTMPDNVATCLSTPSAIEKHLPKAHLVIGAVLVPGSKAPKLITRKLLSSMQKGAVLIDVAAIKGLF